MLSQICSIKFHSEKKKLYYNTYQQSVGNITDVVWLVIGNGEEKIYRKIYTINDHSTTLKATQSGQNQKFYFGS